MKILYITHEKNLNGASKALIEIITKLEDKNSIYVLTKFGEGQFYDELCKHKVRVVIYPFANICDRRNIYLRWLYWFIKWHIYDQFINTLTAKKISKLVREENIQVIHSNTSVVDMGIRIKKICKIPHIMHIREFGDKDFKMYPFITKKKYFEEMNRYTDYFICISKAILEHYTQLLPAKKVLVYDGIPTDVVHSKVERSAFESRDNINILLAGRISKEKGQRQAYKAMKYLYDMGCTNIHLYFAGAGRFYISPKYRRNIHKLGYVEDIQNIRKLMNIEIVCSKAEAFGRVTVEAMLAGNPVIGSNTGGTLEIIRNHENGLLYEYGNHIDLANRILEYIQNDKLRKTYAENALKDVYECFALERCVKEILEVYNKALG